MSEEGSNSSGDSVGSTLLFYFFEYCCSDSLSEEGIREIFEQEGLTPNNQNVDDYDFFHVACRNDRVTEGIIRCLLEYFPNAARSQLCYEDNGWTPLHYACDNKNVTLNIIQLLIDAEPDSVSSVDNYGDMPLHVICFNSKVDDETAMQIMMLLIEKYPEATRRVDTYGQLPIHLASWKKSPEFCRVLIEAYPESERITQNNGELPLHRACAKCNFDTVRYLYNLFPNSIVHTTPHGYYPIHIAIMGACINDDNLDVAPAAAEIVKFLLNCDPNVTLQKFNGWSLLDFACDSEGDNLDDSNIRAALAVIEVIFDAHPEAIEDERIVSNIQNCHKQVQSFLNDQLVYARQAKDHRHMTTTDMNGQLPLHTAVQNNDRLGSIKLLLKGNPAALQSSDNGGALPLHVACMHHDSTDIIEYLVGLDPSTLDAVDGEGNAVLHLACRGARYDIVALFLEKYGAVSVSRRNADEKLPIDLLWESNAVVDRRSTEYTECMYRLLRANPEMIMGIDVQTMQSSASTSLTLPCQAGKKRKLGQ